MKRDPWNDILAAFGLLTRLPLPPHRPAGADAAWAWPVVGLGVGAAAGTAGLLAEGWTTLVAAVVVLAVQAMLTGAMHEDGLADTADGLWGGWTRERRLDIMKDSHIGTFGVLALVLVTLARWSALVVLIGAGDVLWAVIAAGALSRAPMAVMAAALPHARRSGLSHGVGRPDAGTALLAMALALVIAVPAVGSVATLQAALLAAVLCTVLALVAQSKIGGQTGDILGAAQQLSEAAVLAALAGQYA
ncbi:MAG: adenosylcobinamide-GDP ribazoletransferase [Gemmobacter sp.]